MKKILIAFLVSGSAMLVAAGFGVELLSFKELLRQSAAAFVVGIGLGTVLVLAMHGFDQVEGYVSELTPKQLSFDTLFVIIAGTVCMLLTPFGWGLWQIYFLVRHWLSV